MRKTEIKLTEIHLDDKVVHAVEEVLLSGNLAQGKRVAELETSFARKYNSRYAAAVVNGTAALHAALHVVGVKPGDEVITTPFTFVATANAIIMAGAAPVFADIDETTYNIDPESVKELITKKTTAIIAVDLYGLPADYKSLGKIAQKNDLVLIEDAAQSVGAKYDGKYTGTLGDISTFSFYATKNLMSGEGGMVTSTNQKYIDKVRSFRHQGQATERYSYVGIGYNYRMTDVLAVIAKNQLGKIDSLNSKRRNIATQYSQELRDVKGITPPFTPEKSTHAYHQYTIRLSEEFPMNRDMLRQYLEKRKIQSKVYYPVPLHKFPHLQQGHKKSLPVAESVAQTVLSLPVHPSLSKKDVNYVIETIRKI